MQDTIQNTFTTIAAANPEAMYELPWVSWIVLAFKLKYIEA